MDMDIVNMKDLVRDHTRRTLSFPVRGRRVSTPFLKKNSPMRYKYYGLKVMDESIEQDQNEI